MLSVTNCSAILQHIIAATLAPGRGKTPNELIAELENSNDLRHGGFAMDSLDQLAVARQIAEFFELEKAGTEELLLRQHRLDQWADVVLDSIREGTLTHFRFRSGGTTGEKKLISQSTDHLMSEAADLNRLVPDANRIIALVPLHHIYGFIWGPLLSDRLSIPLLHGPAALNAAHQGLQRGDLLIGVPEWWNYFGSSHSPLPPGVKGVTSTAPCPPEVVKNALARGLTLMIEVYGSSETAGIGWRDDGNTAFQLFDHWQRSDNGHLEAAAGGIYPLPDSVHWETPRLLRPGKRRDNAIQIGGTNVWPDRVSAFLEEHPQVKACAVRPMTTDQGNRLKAFIVPAATTADLEQQMRTWINTHLPAPERPVHLTFGTELPRDSMGKLCDW